MRSFEEVYNILAEYVTDNTEALDLAFSLNGCNEETAEDILFYYTGWHSFDGFLAELNDED